MSTEPKTGLTYWAAGILQPDLLFNALLRRYGAIGEQPRVKDKDLTAPPGAPADGDSYIVGAGATGAWAGHDNQVAWYDQGWVFYTPAEGWRLYVIDEDQVYAFDGAAWNITGAGGINQLTGDVTAGPGTGSQVATLAPVQGGAHTWNLAQTFTLAPIFTDQAGSRTALGLGSAATLDSDTDGTLAANSDARVPTQKAVKTAIANAVTGLWDMKGSTDASANPNYPAASKGDAYAISVAGKIGGAAGTSVDVGDIYVALADNAGGDEAAVGASWMHIEHNLVGVALQSGDLSQFAATTSAQLRSLLTDETGTGSAVFANAPALVDPTVGTQAPADNSMKAASTAYADAAAAAAAAAAVIDSIADADTTHAPSRNAVFDALATKQAALALAANQFYARDSAGAAANKTISDDGLALVAGANFAAMRTSLSLNNVSNDAQTKAAIVPNTAPAAGAVLVGNAGGTAYASVSISGDVTLSALGVMALATVQSAAHTWSAAQTFGAALATSAGVAWNSSSTAPAQIATAQAGSAYNITASNAVAGSGTVGAAAGGKVTITGGNAARLTSGNAAGGDVELVGGTGIGTGRAGKVIVPQGTLTEPGVGFSGGITHYGWSYNGGAVWIIANNVQQVYVSPGIMSGNDGATIFRGFKVAIDPRTANFTQTPTLSNAVTTNEGATSKVVVTLSTAAAGNNHAFAVQDADGIRIVASAGDTIRVIDKVTAAAGYIESTTIGSTVYLVAINATEWFAMYVHGTWTDGTFTYDDTGLTTP